MVCTRQAYSGHTNAPSVRKRSRTQPLPRGRRPVGWRYAGHRRQAARLGAPCSAEDPHPRQRRRPRRRAARPLRQATSRAKWTELRRGSSHRTTAPTSGSYEGNEIPNIGLNAVAGRPPEEYGIEPTSLAEIRKGCYDIDERVKRHEPQRRARLDVLPVASCSSAASCSRGRRTSTWASAMLRAYNDWHIDEWCGTYPGRFIPLSIPPIWDPQLMADEVRRVADEGLPRGHVLREPGEARLAAASLGDHWDPFFAACEDEGTVICLHIGSSSTQLVITAGRADRRDDHAARRSTSMQARHRPAVVATVFRKFPNLKFAPVRGRHRLDPVLARADRLRVPAAPLLDRTRTSATSCRARWSATTSSLCFISDRPALTTATASASTRSRGSATTRTRTPPGRTRLRRWPSRGGGRPGDGSPDHPRERDAHLPVRPVRAPPEGQCTVAPCAGGEKGLRAASAHLSGSTPRASSRAGAGSAKPLDYRTWRRSGEGARPSGGAKPLAPQPHRSPGRRRIQLAMNVTEHPVVARLGLLHHALCTVDDDHAGRWHQV